MIEQAYLFITGGVESGDIKVWREDIENYLPAAINYVFVMEHRQDLAETVQMARMMGSWPDTAKTTQDFLVTAVVTPELDSSRNLYWVKTPVPIMSLPKGRGLDRMWSKGGESLLVKCVSQSEVIGMDHGIFYWPEKIGTESKIFIKGLDPSVCELFVAYVPSVADLKATDEIFVPNGSEIKIFRLLKEWFLGQRQVPEDTANDNKEQPIQ